MAFQGSLDRGGYGVRIGTDSTLRVAPAVANAFVERRAHAEVRDICAECYKNVALLRKRESNPPHDHAAICPTLEKRSQAWDTKRSRCLPMVTKSP